MIFVSSKGYENDQEVQLPKALIEQTDIKDNNFFNNKLNEETNVFKRHRKQHIPLEQRALKYNGNLGIYEKFDWGDFLCGSGGYSCVDGFCFAGD